MTFYVEMPPGMEASGWDEWLRTSRDDDNRIAAERGRTLNCGG